MKFAFIRHAVLPTKGKFLTSLALAAGGLISSANAQQNEPPERTIEVQLVMVGQPVPPRFKVEKPVDLHLPGGGDAGAKEQPKPSAAGVAVQIPREPDEIPPGPLYAKSGKEWVPVISGENSPSPKVKIKTSGTVVIAARKDVQGSNGKPEAEYRALGDFQVGDKQESLLILLIKDPGKPEKWNLARKIALDTTWKQMPGGSVTVFNAVGLPLRGQVAKDVVANVPAFQTVNLKPTGEGAVPYFFEVRLPNGTWQRVVNSGMTLPQDARLFLIPYGIVEPKTGRVASLVMIRDTQTVSAPPAAAPPAADPAAASAAVAPQ